MKLKDIKSKLHKNLFNALSKDIDKLRPSQVKSIKAGLFEGKNLLVCTPTASGKTLIAEFAALNTIYSEVGKAVYVVPLKALASEKHKDFKERYNDIRIALSIGDKDSADKKLDRADLIITTSEKLDALIRHNVPWLKYVSVVIIDEIHLLNDPSRGPTLEILITILKKILPKMQMIALSATIGNPKELAQWLDAKLVQDSWRPVELKKGVYLDGEIEFS